MNFMVNEIQKSKCSLNQTLLGSPSDSDDFDLGQVHCNIREWEYLIMIKHIDDDYGYFHNLKNKFWFFNHLGRYYMSDP